MGATVDTQTLDLRAQSGLDAGKSRGGQGEKADAFAAVLSDLDDAKPTVPTDAASSSPAAATPVVPSDTGRLNLSAGTFAVTSASSTPAAATPVAPPDAGRLNLSAGTFAVTSASSTPAAASALLPGDKSATLRPQLSLPDATAIPASVATADTSTSIGQAAIDGTDSTTSTTSFFQALIDGTGAKTSTKAKPGQRDDDAGPAATPTVDAQSALTLPALIAAAAASAPAAASTPTAPPSVTTQAASDVKVTPSNKAALPVTSSSAVTTDDAAGSANTTVSISDVKVETHLAVAASHAVAKDTAEPQTSKAEVVDPSLPTSALTAMAPQTQSVVQAVETLLDQAPVAATADPASTPTAAPPRTMTLQLTPPDLGTVQVRLHLNGQALDLQLSVSSTETLGTISRDRSHLETALASQNYDLRSLTIQGADGTGAATTGDPQTGGRGASGEQGGAQNQGSSTSGNSAGGGGHERRAANSRGIASDEDARTTTAPRAGALFV